MDAYVIVALIAAGLILAEMVLPTGGAIGAIGVLGFFAAGVVALSQGGSDADWIGGALIALAIASGITLYVVARKVYTAHRDQPVRGGTEEMIGTAAEARTAVEVGSGQVFTRGTLWSARLAEGSEPAPAGSRVTVEAVDGLTLVVRPAPEPAQTSGGSGS
jgi:membrane protein implicated in regulation of membrane protease activity